MSVDIEVYSSCGRASRNLIRGLVEATESADVELEDCKMETGRGIERRVT